MKENGRTSIAAGIPTTQGSIIFWSILFDDAKLLKYARGRISQSQFNDLKERLGKRDALSQALRDSIGPGLSDFVEAMQYELPVIIPAPQFSDDSTDLLEDIKKEIKKLSSVVELVGRIQTPLARRKSGKSLSPFNDVELQLWPVECRDKETVLGAVRGATDFEAILDEWDEIAAEGDEDDDHESSIVILLRTDVDAKITLDDFEARISKELKSLNSFEPRPAFITLVG